MITIIPAIDLIDGKCVRLQQGDYGRKIIYNENPVEVAKEFEDHGITHLHLVDLDGAKAKHVVNHSVLEKITTATSLNVDFGGGIKSNEDIRKVFDAGAKQVAIGSIAATDRELMYRWIEEHGADKIILGADVKDRMIAVSGWLDVTGLELNDFLTSYLAKGISYVLCTDISRDGMMQGTALELYKELNHAFPGMKLIASGGITHIDEIEELNREGIYGAIVGKAIYEGKISLEDLARFHSK